MADMPKQTGTETVKKAYHTPTLRSYGNARDLIRSNAGSGPDGAIFDGADFGTDGAGTAS